MTLKTALTALALSLTPAIGFAYSCNFGTDQAQSCAPGTQWNADQQACVEIVNS